MTTYKQLLDYSRQVNNVATTLQHSTLPVSYAGQALASIQFINNLSTEVNKALAEHKDNPDNQQEDQ